MGADPDPAGVTANSYVSNYGGWCASSGMLMANETTCIIHCTDGTSNTIMAAEQSAAVGTADLRNRYYSPWGGVTISTPLSQTPAGRDLWGMGVTCVAYAMNAKTAAAGSNIVYGGNPILNSNHPNGINVLFTDGSVRYVTESTDFANFQKLCSRNDGMPTSEP